MEGIERNTSFDVERVKVILAQIGVSLRNRPRKLTPSVISEAVELRQRGESWQVLACQYGVCGASVREAVLKHRRVGAADM